MNRFQLNSFSASVKFAPFKTCFIYIPETWLSDSSREDIHVFKLLYGEKKEAFVSCLPSKQIKEKANVLINAKYAEKLELKEHEKVFLQPLRSHLPNIQEITLEPLTSDDWEILELNANIIENEVMNQIRIVWMTQIFPMWVNGNSIHVKVAQIKPVSQAGILVEFTEVHVVPKGRCLSETQTSIDNIKSDKKTSPFSQFCHLGRRKSCVPSSSKSKSMHDENSDYYSFDSENKSTTLRAFSLLSSFFSSTKESKIMNDYQDERNDEFVPLDLSGILRVIPHTRPDNPILPLVVQATTVFINATTFIELYGDDTEIPPCFVAVLKKYPSPESKKEKKLPAQQKQSKDGVSNDTSTRSLERGKSKTDVIMQDDKQRPFDSVCVTVMVVPSAEEDEFHLPISLFYSKNLIVVPKQLKKCLNLEVSSLVHLKGVQMKPTTLNKVMFHPINALAPNINEEIIAANLENWIHADKGSSSYVLSEGSYICLRLYGRKNEFFISLPENLDQTANTSSSTLNSLSPTSSVSEQKTAIKEPAYGYLNISILKKISVVLGSQMYVSIHVDRPYLRNTEGLYLNIKSTALENLGGVKELADQALESLEFWLKLRPITYISNHPFTFCGSMLICGPKGVGKSSFANALCKELASLHQVFIKVTPCLPLKGKRVETIAKKWDDSITEAVSSQPSVILFEDLDCIASCPLSHEQEAGPDGVYFSNIVQAFIHMINRVRASESKLVIIVTAQSTHSLHPLLMNTKGRHMFQVVIDIQPPNTEQREDILKSLVSRKYYISETTKTTVSWSKIASKTEGYLAQDLDSLVDRATHAAWVRMTDVANTQDVILNVEDFEMALGGYVPSSLRGVPLQPVDHKSWRDVGGLYEVKKIIQQIIMWPVKYKQIFKNYSLKPQTNILLYGAPGTGKTLLAGVIANECGLNFISIKGPELLSKYIGASEQAVRDLFKRATTARPCILFFDEFDSIAPRRGHDSTGVTDRVVNQLLTQLDGVESLEGVHVIAASSRPELIDPALLRPGRLDKCLLCPLPDEKERLDILKCLSLRLPLSDDVEFEPIAAMTEHFSGADMQALLYTAHIEALHDVQSSSTRRYSTSSKDLSYVVASDKLLYMPTVEDGLKTPVYEDGQKIIQEVSVIKENFYGVLERRNSRRRSTLCVSITQKNLLKVAEEMKPSVSPQERQRYERVFKNFQGNISGESVSNLMENVKRVTLA